MQSEFVTCLNCIDGRTQLPVIHWIKENYGVEYVDMITEGGIVGCLADKSFNIDNILNKVSISIDQHGSEHIFIVGHDDCAGNPVNPTTHKKQIIDSVNRIKCHILSCKVTGLWVSNDFKVHKIKKE